MEGSGQPPIIVASYERVSTRLQGQYGYSLMAQQQSMTDFAKAHNWQLTDRLRFRDGEDENASGKDWDLPGLNAMLEAARAGEFAILIVPDLDRFARSLVKGLVLEEQLRKYGVRIIYQRVPVEDSPEGRLLKNQLFSFAEFEREKLLLRTATGAQAKARAGMVVGRGYPPYGYRFVKNERGVNIGLEPDDVTAPIARRIFLDLRACSTEDIAANLNVEHILGPRGGRWVSSTIRRIGFNPVYVGRWCYGRHELRERRNLRPGDDMGIVVTVPALISQSEWDAVQDALSRRRVVRRGRQPKENDTYLLRGLLTCGHCHRLLQVAISNGVRYYRCGCNRLSTARRYGQPLCDLPAINAEAIEDELWQLLTRTLLDQEYLTLGLQAAREQYDGADQLRRDRLVALDTEIDRQRKRLDAITLRALDTDPMSEITASLNRTQQTIDELLSRLMRERSEVAVLKTGGLPPEQAEAIEAFAASAHAGLDNATPADRRTLYEMIQVQGNVRHDPERCDPDSVRLGRFHRFAIDWRAAISLGNSTPCSVINAVT